MNDKIYSTNSNLRMNRSTNILIVIFGVLFFFQSNAQAPKKYTSADIHESIQKLNVLGSVLYVAAHPDDENTRLISYFANERKMETTYLSLTRGDGGQNLIGPEIRELLGVIRTQELLAARRIDGGKQMFSRANDFGYSKSPIETMEVWNKDEVLSDVVFALRKIQPDIVINRFSNNLESRTHGHHTASAVLSTEAFDLSNNKSVYPEQLAYVQPWQAKRLFFNTSWWFYGSRDAFEKADKSNMLSVNAGVYYPIKGKSNGEIAAESRSMHKCQGMGSTGFRGNQMEYLQYLKGMKVQTEQDPFEGIDITWNRLPYAGHIAGLVEQVEASFDHAHPEKSLAGLSKIKKEIEQLSDSKWKKIKLKEVDDIIFQCAGLYIELIANDHFLTPGEHMSVQMELIKRSTADVSFQSLQLSPSGSELDSSFNLPDNEAQIISLQLEVPRSTKYSNAYWLEQKASLGMYRVDNQELRGLPETQKETYADLLFHLEGTELSVKIPIIHKKTDPVKGEVYRPLEITPPVSIAPTGNVYVFGNHAPKEIAFVVKSGKKDFQGQVQLKTNSGNWTIEPSYHELPTLQKGEEHIVKFLVTPPKEEEESEIICSVISDSIAYTDQVINIEYDHIPAQIVIEPATSKIVHVDLEKAGNRVAYVMGAGDDIPASLAQVGYEVTEINAQDLTIDRLKYFDAVILGIRAYNTEERLKFKNQVLFDFAKQGGNVIVQYNTNRRLVTEDIAPYPIKISRERVAVEEAPVRFLLPEHPVLNEPNEITKADFDGWVQERGLYFASEWAPEFKAILSSNDPGEDPRDGGLLIAKHGEGHFIYTGYSWFRELPAGVPGAYRLFTNIISLGRKNRS